MSYLDLSRKPSPKNPDTLFTGTPLPTGTASSSPMTITPTERSPTPTVLFSPTVRATATSTVAALTSTPIRRDARPVTYSLQRGEYPYCIARRFNVDPGELLVLNGLSNRQTFYAGTILQIPQTGDPYPGQRMQMVHPATYTVSRADETMYTIACQFGDADPAAIAEANNLSVDSALYAGQQLNIP
jgi:LysM repeat protein